MPADCYRHVDQWSFTDAAEVLASEAPTTLTRPQRLTIADELAADAAERASSVQVLTVGDDPASGGSRAWQLREVTRSLRNGQTGPLPEGAASWLVRSWGPDLGPAERWAARDRLVRIEQLVTACEAHGGRAAVQDDPLLAHREFARRLALLQGVLRWTTPGRRGNCLLAVAVLATALLTSAAATGRLMGKAAQNWGALALEPSAAQLFPW